MIKISRKEFKMERDGPKLQLTQFHSINFIPATHYRREIPIEVTDEGIIIPHPGNEIFSLFPFTDDIFKGRIAEFLDDSGTQIHWSSFPDVARNWLQRKLITRNDKTYIRAIIWFNISVQFRTRKVLIGTQSFDKLLEHGNCQQKNKLEVLKIIFFALDSDYETESKEEPPKEPSEKE